jgi:hypothetical protein
MKPHGKSMLLGNHNHLRLSYLPCLYPMHLLSSRLLEAWLHAYSEVLYNILHQDEEIV